MSNSSIYDKLKNQQYISILKSSEYKSILSDMARRIVSEAERATNEATIENYFDCELFAFFRTVFGPLGYQYRLVKEEPIATKIHVSKGRADSAIGALIIEFKHHSKLSSEKDKTKALKQLSKYLLGMYEENKNNGLGFLTDGVKCCFVQQENGNIFTENFDSLNITSFDRLVRNIILLELTALNSKKLVNDFCDTKTESGIAFELVKSLYSVLVGSIHPKSKMLFDEWKKLFKLAHDDVSKQQAILNRKRSLEKIIGISFSNNDEEYL